MMRGAMAGIALLAILAGPGTATAEPLDRPIAAAVARISFATERAETAGDAAATRMRFQHPGTRPRRRAGRGASASAARSPAPPSARSGGAFLGGYLGAKLEPACHCDDPGLAGAS